MHKGMKVLVAAGAVLLAQAGLAQAKLPKVNAGIMSGNQQICTLLSTNAGEDPNREPCTVTVRMTVVEKDGKTGCQADVLNGIVKYETSVRRIIVWEASNPDPMDKGVYEFDKNDGIHIVKDADRQIVKNVGGYWKDSNGKEQPWTFFRVNWNTVTGSEVDYIPVIYRRKSGKRVLCESVDPKITNDGG